MATQNWMFVGAAYFVTWLVVAGYGIRVFIGLRAARRAAAGDGA